MPRRDPVREHRFPAPDQRNHLIDGQQVDAVRNGQRAAYPEVCDGVSPADLLRDELDCRRAKDKSDKSLELYKFYVNALYVATTRAVETLTIIESDTSHPLLELLGLKPGEARAMPAQTSTKEEWAREARRLELQGKQEQARAIRETFLQGRPVPWTPWSRVSPSLVQFAAPPNGGIWRISLRSTRLIPLQSGGISWSAVRRAEKQKPLISSTKSGA